MKLICLDDKGGWGRQLRDEAQRRKWEVEMVTNKTAPYAQGDYAFMRLAQNAEDLIADKAAYLSLARHVRVIPDINTGTFYEDKLQQAMAYGKWMPYTRLLYTALDARRALDQMDYPFVSKSRTGSASRNVRLIKNKTEAEVEIGQAFGAGIEAPHKLGEHRQRGYLIWQDFVPGNKYDYRIVRTGRYMMILQRHNTPGTPFASGSGVNNPAPMNDEAMSALWFANDFFKAEKAPWCGIDIVKGPLGDWFLLETTLGWSQKAYLDCPYYWIDSDILTMRCIGGAHMWSVLCDEIEAGVFQ